METINLVILDNSDVNKYIPLLRKQTSKSMSEIKKDIIAGESVIEYDYYDADELTSLVKTFEELLLMGADIKIFEDEEEITLDMVKNLIETIEGVAKDREEMDHLMYGDDSD